MVASPFKWVHDVHTLRSIYRNIEERNWHLHCAYRCYCKEGLYGSRVSWLSSASCALLYSAVTLAILVELKFSCTMAVNHDSTYYATALILVKWPYYLLLIDFLNSLLYTFMKLMFTNQMFFLLYAQMRMAVKTSFLHSIVYLPSAPLPFCATPPFLPLPLYLAAPSRWALAVMSEALLKVSSRLPCPCCLCACSRGVQALGL